MSVADRQFSSPLCPRGYKEEPLQPLMESPIARMSGLEKSNLISTPGSADLHDSLCRVGDEVPRIDVSRNLDDLPIHLQVHLSQFLQPYQLSSRITHLAQV